MKTLGAVRRGGGDAAWQQSGDRTVFALTGAPGRAGPLLDLLAEVKDPDPESLAEAARKAGFVSAETPLLLGVLEGTELVLFGAGGAVCRRLRGGESRDLLDPADRTSYSTGQTILARGDDHPRQGRRPALLHRGPWGRPPGARNPSARRLAGRPGQR